MVMEDMYVDDMLSGADTEEEAVQRLMEVKELLSAGCFPIRKWSSNSSVVLQNVSEGDREKLTKIGERDMYEGTRALGLFWNTKCDTFTFDSWPENMKQQSLTKRQVLSEISRLYDPLGLVSPVIVRAKLIMQRLWSCKLEWDDQLEGDILQDWDIFRDSFTKLNQIELPRCVKIPGACNFEIHGFSDASTLAYGACVYLRNVFPDGRAEARLLCAKSRVAPLKITTIPRLELRAAELLTTLVVKVIKVMEIDVTKVTLWSDSQITLAWLKKPLDTLEVFVRNRVVKINNLSSCYEWKYVNTKQNPADVVSRGQAPEALSQNMLWWNGPKFLKQEYFELDHLTTSELEIPGVKVTAAVILIEALPVFSKISNFRKLQRIIAYVNRFILNCKNKAKYCSLITTAYVTVPEMEASLKTIVKILQMLELPNEITTLEKGQIPPKLANLSPFLDEDHLIRVGGRLQEADFPYRTKHPLILPNHRVAETIIRALHIENLHIGPSGLLAIVRRTFWPLKGRSTTRKVTRSCIQCFRIKPRKVEQLMGNLPGERVSIAAPFEFTGVDYAGPVAVKQGKYRPKIVKGYIAVFVCLATKNLHLELVSDLTTEAFIAALERFINRRGLVRKIFSDNGTNFVGASRELRELFVKSRDEIHLQKVNEMLLVREIEWQFIPPRAPNFGGLWEAGVKSVKTHLKRTLQNAILTFEEYCTILTHVESILNSRPLFNASDNPNEPLPITPAHLQIGRPLVCVPKPSYANIPDNRLSRWQYLDKLRQHFWRRWSREYLMTLQARSKWTSRSSSITPGSVVLLVEDNLPPQTWKLGIVTAVHPGKDSLVRVADIKTSTGTYRRSISKLAPLPVENDECLQVSASQPRGKM